MENETQDRVALNRQLAQMLKGGVIMDVTTPEQARIAEEAGACAVMAMAGTTVPAVAPAASAILALVGLVLDGKVRKELDR